jgi:polyferredoxin
MYQIPTFFSNLADQLFFRFLVEGGSNQSYTINRSIESMDTQEFSIGVFYFLIIAIIVFVVIAFLFMFKNRGKKSNLKRGEKVLFIWIMLGVVVAVIFGAAQMIEGYLF